MAERLSGCGLAVVHPSFANRLRARGFRFLSKCAWLPELALRTLVRRPKRVIVNDFGALVALLVAWPVFRPDSVVVVHHGLISAGSGTLQTQKTWLAHWFVERQGFKQVAVSDFLATELRSRHGFTIHSVAYLPLLPALEEGSVGTLDEASRPRHFVLFAGRVNESKLPLATTDLVHGWFRELGRDGTLLVAGPDAHGWAGRLEEESEVPVTYLGAVSRADVARLMSQADIVLNPSTLPEACPTVAAEAAAVGAPYAYLRGNGNRDVCAFLASPTFELGTLTEAEGRRLARRYTRSTESRFECVPKARPSADELVEAIS